MSKLSIETSEIDRKILLDALQLLRSSAPNLAAEAVASISRLQDALSSATDAVPAPRHVTQDAPAIEKMMALGPEADIWGLSIVPNERSIGTFRLFGESTTRYGTDREKTLRFEIANGLRGTDKFMELDTADQEFVDQLRSKISAALGYDASQMTYGVFDVPLPWSFEPHLDTDERITQFLIAAKEDNDFYIPEIHDVLLQEHASPELRELGFANAKVYASAREEHFDEITALIVHVNHCIRDGIGPAGEDYSGNMAKGRWT